MQKLIKHFNLKIIYKYLKYIIKLFVFIIAILYIIAILMSDHANNDWVKLICREYVNGPKNMIALIVDKASPGAMKIDSVFVPQAQPAQEMPEHEKAVKAVLERYQKQAAIDEKLRAEYESGDYSFDDPFVIVNPYGISPLTALVMFDTDEEMQESVRVIGHNENEDVLMPPCIGQYKKKHIIPIYGLYAGEMNKIIITLIDKNGREKNKEVSIITEDLVSLLKNLNFKTIFNNDLNNNPQLHPLNFSQSSMDAIGMKCAFDLNGNIRWYFLDVSIYANYNNGKNIYRAIGADYYGDTLILQESYLGRIEKMFYLPSGVHHDVHLTDYNTLLVTSHHEESLEDLGIEIDIATGNFVNEIDYRKLLPRGRHVGILHFEGEDWAHNNAIVDYQGDYISSSNFQSAVFRHSKDGKIKWILSDPAEYTTYWRQYLLTPVGDNFEYPYNQHAVEVLPDYDNNPDTVDILLFDNGTSRNAMNAGLQENIKLGRAAEPPLYSRLVHYRINEKNMTVEQIWSYGKERPELFSETRGDADLLPNGNILGTFPHENGLAIKSRFPAYDTVYVEVDRNGNVVWECYAASNARSNKYLDYRLCRTNIYNPSVDYSHLLDESHNFVPDEIMKKYGF